MFSVSFRVLTRSICVKNAFLGHFLSLSDMFLLILHRTTAFNITQYLLVTKLLKIFSWSKFCILIMAVYTCKSHILDITEFYLIVRNVLRLFFDTLFLNQSLVLQILMALKILDLLTTSKYLVLYHLAMTKYLTRQLKYAQSGCLFHIEYLLPLLFPLQYNM